MKVGYARVSTDEQNLNLQHDALKAAGCEKVFQNDGFSGALTDRPGLEQALETVQKGDVLVVWKLDRLGRSLAHLIHVIEALGEGGVEFVSLSENIDTTTAGGRLVFHMMGALAEFERALIAERSKAGMIAARKRGKHVGRPRKLKPEQIRHAKEMVKSGQQTVTGMAELYEVDRSTMHRALKR
jgi:DNA invertase Pin-like site-specific DNA recombinase